VVANFSYEEDEEVDHPNVEDNVLIDDINDDSENDVDTLNDPFDIIDYELDHDTNIDFDEEEDK
jgi:hypothetical protein